MTDVGSADAFGHRHKANVGEALAAELRDRTGIETLASELTYDLRSGEPDSIDSLVATTFANVAMDLVESGITGRMVAIQDGKYAHTHLPDPALGPRMVDVPALYNVARFRPRYDGEARRPDAAGRTGLAPGRGAGGRAVRPRARTAPRIARASAEMSSSAWPPAMRPRLELGGDGRDRQGGTELRGELEGDPEVLAVERDLEPERVVVVEHPAAPVGQDPALGRAPAERADDLLDVEPGLDAPGRCPRRRRDRRRPG